MKTRGLVKKALVGTAALVTALAFLLLPFVPAGAGPISVEVGGAPQLPKVQLSQIATASLPACSSTTEGTVYYDTTANALSVCNASANVSMAGAGSCTNQFVRASNAGAAPTCATVSLTTDTTGVLSMDKGGTNKAATASNGAVVYSDTDSFELSTVGTSRQMLTSGGAAAPVWVTTQATWTGVCFSAAGDGACENAATPQFQGVFSPSVDGRANTSIACSWAAAGSGAGNVVVGIYNCGASSGSCTSPSLLCSCTLTGDCTASNKPHLCTCSGSFTGGNYYMLSLTASTTCATNNPGQIVCTANYTE